MSYVLQKHFHHFLWVYYVFMSYLLEKEQRWKGRKTKKQANKQTKKTQQIGEQIKYSAVEPDRFFLFELTMIHPQSCST